MKKLAFHILVSGMIVFTSFCGLFTAASAATTGTASESPSDHIILKGGYEAKVVDYSGDGFPVYQADFGAPTYCDDLKTPIDARWYEKEDGSFKSGDNQFSADVYDEQILLTKDNESLRWTPALILRKADQGQDLKLKPFSAKPAILDIDPINENYHNNTLVWHYDNGIDRYLRLIEAQCQEYFVINDPLEYDLVIDPDAHQTAGFKWYEKAIAYDDAGMAIPLTEDSQKVVTLESSNSRKSSLTKEEIDKVRSSTFTPGTQSGVIYPIVIDPNCTFTCTTHDGMACYEVDTGGCGNNTTLQWDAAHDTAEANHLFSTNYYDYIRVLLDNTAGQYLTQIMRTFLYFDTSSIADGANISAATLRIFVDTKYTGIGAFNIQVQHSTYYPHDPFVNLDYSYSNYSDNGGQISSNSITRDAYNSIALNATGYSWIDKAGISRFCLRELEHDINDSKPAYPGRDNQKINWIGISSAEVGEGYRPQLIVTFSGPPMPPTNLQASDGTYTDKARVSWTSSSGATGYSLYRNTVDNGIYNFVGNTTTTSYNDTSADPGTSYYYWVLAYNNYGEGELSVPDTGFRKLSPPTNVQASDGTNDGIRIKWTNSTGATGYYVFRNTSNSSAGATQLNANPVSNSPYDDTLVTNGVTYFYWIKAHCDTCDSGLSSGNTGYHINQVGAYWVSSYEHHDVLVSTDEDSQFFLDGLDTYSYNSAFNIGDTYPVEQWLFDDSADPDINPDTVDLFWFDGHGEDGELILIHDWTTFWPYCVYDRVEGENLVWGDGNMEWAFLHACNTLHSDDALSNSYLKSNGKFAQALHGVHLICGADTVLRPWTVLSMQDATPVDEYLTGTGGRPLATVKDAWFWGVDVYEDFDSLGNPIILRVIGEDESYGNDYIWGQGSGPVPDVAVDDYYYSWDFPCNPN
jgi:hypothetical protein